MGLTLDAAMPDSATDPSVSSSSISPIMSAASYMDESSDERSEERARSLRALPHLRDGAGGVR